MTVLPCKNGINILTASDWADLNTFLCGYMLDYRQFVWRGHQSENWKIEPTLDRLLKRRGKSHLKTIRDTHLGKFKLAARGRRGINPQRLDTDNDWWALGQHNGLATPLIDWTTSPFVATYFAFAGESDGGNVQRAIFGISKS